MLFVHETGCLRRRCPGPLASLAGALLHPSWVGPLASIQPALSPNAAELALEGNEAAGRGG